MRAPDAPIGWPSAHAPPCTLTFSCGSRRSFIAAIVTAANASLISYRSTSFARPAGLLEQLVDRADRGGREPAPAPARASRGRRRARAASGRAASAVDARISTSAAAPSEIDDDVRRRDRAVLVERGLQRRDLVEIGLERLLVACRSTCRRPCGPLPSPARFPRRSAAFVGLLSARASDSIANASCASRVKPYSVAHSSANTPIAGPCRRRLRGRRGTCGRALARGPCGMPPRAFGSRYGALVMLSMPPATMTSALPASSMSCANIVARIARAAHLVDRRTARR